MTTQPPIRGTPTSVPPRDHAAIAEALLGVASDDLRARSLRIAGLYALLWLDEPFLASWCGLAAFVSLQVHRALSGPTLGYRLMMAEANVAIYRAIVPSFLRLRDGLPPEGRMAEPFRWLAQADEAICDEPIRARSLVREAVAEISRVEQTEVAQPIFSTLSWWQRRGMRELFLFRLGFDSAAPVVRFPYRNPADLRQRMRFTRELVLPAWDGAQAGRMEWLRADCNRLRQLAELREGDLPATAPPPRCA